MGLLIAVLLSQIAVVGASLKIAVLQNILGFLRSPGSQVYRHHYLCSGLLCPIGKLIQPKLVRLNNGPGQIHLGRALTFRSHTIFPVVTGNKISAGITHNRNLQLLHQVDNILPHPLLIRKRAVLLINSFIYRTSQMLNKGSENSLIHLSCQVVFVYNNLCFLHSLSIPPPTRQISSS